MRGRGAAAVLAVVVLAGCGLVGRGGHVVRDGHGRSRYTVYWDQNEEQDLLSMPSGRTGQLIPPWDPNGQMCLQPGGHGRFVVGYNPTLPSQHNPGSLLPYKDPPIGEALYDRHGHFTGKTIYVPGPYELAGQTRGGDIPPDASGDTYNDNGTMTGCAFDRAGNLFATDLGTAQGQFPPPDDGRLIEWFAPTYDSYCILAGPTTGGVGPHHVDGTGGLQQPGTLAFDDGGDLLLPEAGHTEHGLPAGRVLRLDHTSFPSSATDCGSDGLYPAGRLRTSVFVQGTLAMLPFPIGVAHDPTCDCYAVSTTFGDPAIAWFDAAGQPVASRPPVPGEPLAQVGQDPNGYNPFGLAFAPDGTLYFTDIHIECTGGLLVGCGPASLGGREMKVTFTDGAPDPAVPIATGLDFPTSVTVCVPRRQVCPQP